MIGPRCATPWCAQSWQAQCPLDQHAAVWAIPRGPCQGYPVAADPLPEVIPHDRAPFAEIICPSLGEGGSSLPL